MSQQKIITTVFEFRGGGIIPATTSADSGPLVKKITGSATVAPAGGECVLALDATSEVQNACLYCDDDLSFDIDDIKQMRAWMRYTVAIGTTVTWALGLGSARHDTPASISALLLFTGGTSGVVSVESDDNVTDTAPVSTGLSLAGTHKKFVIDFSKGIHTQSPPSLSLGGKNAVQFFLENGSGLLTRVAPNTRFSMNGYSSGLQPIVQIQKTSSTDVGSIAVSRIEIDHVAPA